MIAVDSLDVALDAHPQSESEVPQHSLIRSACLHLLPGVLIVLFGIGAAGVVRRAGLPLLLVPSLWVLCVLIPFELGYLLWLGKKRNGTLSLKGIVLYRRPLPALRWPFIAATLIAWAIVVFEFIAPPAQSMVFSVLFFWVPTFFVSWFTVASSGGHPSMGALLAVLLYLITNPAAALVEEIYFRGFLLPRLTYLRGWAPVVNTVLFCIYHLHSPWQILGRFLAFLPVAVTVTRYRSISIGIVVHCSLDALSAAALLALLYR